MQSEPLPCYTKRVSWMDIILRLGLGWLALRIAQKKGRDPIIWSLLTAFFYLPIIAIYLLPPVRRTASPQKPPEETFSGHTVEVKPLSKNGKEDSVSTLRYESISWYQLGKERKSEGPYPFSEMQRRFWEGELTEESYIWTPEWSDWKKVSTIPGLLRLLAK